MFAATATAAASGSAVAASHGGLRGNNISTRSARAPAHSAVCRPVRCQAVNGSQQKAGPDILRNGGSAAPTSSTPPPPPPAPAPPPASASRAPLGTSPATTFSDDVANNISFNTESRGTAVGRPAERSKEVLMRAREIMTVDPGAPSALDLIGSKVDIKVEFKVHYETKLGEDLYVIGSHEKLGNWDQAFAVPMTWGEGGNWSVTVDLPAGG